MPSWLIAPLSIILFATPTAASHPGHSLERVAAHDQTTIARFVVMVSPL